jgi:hypothetical protein
MALIKALTRKIRVFCVCFPQISQKTFGMALIKALSRKIRVFRVCFPRIYGNETLICAEHIRIGIGMNQTCH